MNTYTINFTDGRWDFMQEITACSKEGAKKEFLNLYPLFNNKQHLILSITEEANFHNPANTYYF